jgi:hypothetical protein
MQDITQMAIVAAAISAFVQFVKSSTHLHSTGTRLLVVGLSGAGAAGYWFVHDTSLWMPFLEILGLANTVYLFAIKPFEE